MKESDFNKLIDQYLKDQLNSGEKQKVEYWLNHLAEDQVFDQLSEKEQVAIKANIKYQLFNQEKCLKKPAETVKITWLKPFLKIASCIAVISVLIFSFRTQLKELFNIGQSISVVNIQGRITKSILADGTIVWLKGNSKLSFPVKFKGQFRIIELQGEALFEVAKDAAHPFIIHSGALTTCVLGTSFNIKHLNDKVEVTVLTGHVFLSSKNPAAVNLLPYQKAIFFERKKILVKEAKPKFQVTDLTNGTDYNMLFDDAGLAEIIRRIEKKFEVSIFLKNPELSKNLITADLTDQSLTNSLDMICGTLNLNYSISNQQVFISKHKSN